MRPAYIAQLPFPSSSDPHPLLLTYYRDYAKRFTEDLPSFFIPEGSLWELPLWVAHLAGMMKAINVPAELIELSRAPPRVEACTAELLNATSVGDLILFSPIAQNFDLALEVSRCVLAEGRRTAIGGNMASFAGPDDASYVHRGTAEPSTLRAIYDGQPPAIVASSRYRRISYVPDYSLLSSKRGSLPLLRLHASHGCLYACTFCGDAWSRQLHVVEQDALELEVQQLERLFPETRLIYVGDKTFGQSAEAVSNLLKVFKDRPEYRFIVQTHFLRVDDALIAAMRRLGVICVELGFETADSTLLAEVRKGTRGIEHCREVLSRLKAAGIRAILNVLGCLPGERISSHARTVDFISSATDLVWLYNLYGFVPYPLTPEYQALKERVFDWRFCNWREDAPPVFRPYYLSVEESWHCFLDKIDAAHRAINA
jgi:Radical SAM superfamily